MPAVSVERLPVQAFGLGLIGFDHLQIVFRGVGAGQLSSQDEWFVIEGLREEAGGRITLAVEGWDGGTTLSEANGGLTGAELEARIGTADMRGPRLIAEGATAIDLWARLAATAADIAAQEFPYIAGALPSSPVPTINSSSLVASLLHHAGLRVEAALPHGMRLSPGTATLLGTSGDDTLATSAEFSTLVGGAGNDTLIGRDTAAGRTEKFYGGAGDDIIRWAAGSKIMHGGLPGLPYAEDGHDAVDYSGAGEVRLDAVTDGIAHVTPDFVVTTAGGRTYLLSIEDIIWDSRSDRLVLGDGVVATPVSSVTQLGAAGPPSPETDGGAETHLARAALSRAPRIADKNLHDALQAATAAEEKSIESETSDARPSFGSDETGDCGDCAPFAAGPLSILDHNFPPLLPDAAAWVWLGSTDLMAWG